MHADAGIGIVNGSAEQVQQSPGWVGSLEAEQATNFACTEKCDRMECKIPWRAIEASRTWGRWICCSVACMHTWSGSKEMVTAWSVLFPVGNLGQLRFSDSSCILLTLATDRPYSGLAPLPKSPRLRLSPANLSVAGDAVLGKAVPLEMGAKTHSATPPHFPSALHVQATPSEVGNLHGEP